ncbi:MAG: hypothetical protein ACRDAM_06430 [Casimicrobium sp.]
MVKRSLFWANTLGFVFAALAGDFAFSQTTRTSAPDIVDNAHAHVSQQGLKTATSVLAPMPLVPTATCATVRPRVGTAACSLDIDGDGFLTATDALLAMRYMLGFRGDALSQVVSSNACALNTTSSAIEAAIVPLLAASPPALDIDGDQQATEMIDGMLLLRAMVGRTGSEAMNGLASTQAGATRTTWTSVRNYLNDTCLAALFEQYTPNQANWNTFATKPFVGSSPNTGHDPDGVSWISQAQWAAAAWDGTTTYNPSTMTRAEFASAICPSGDRVRGLREVFYQHRPFADNKNPTKAEIDEWHRIAINHVRALVGYTSEDRKVKKDRCMFARSLWGDERKFTTKWDTKYPTDTCVGSANAHCGSTFVPDAQDQAPYLPEGHAACGTPGGAEGVFSAPKSNIPWSIKWSRAFCGTLSAEGFWGGHTGPWFHREKFGFSFWDADVNNNNSNTILRAKWTGTLMPSLYCNPADPQCTP